jgi:hypothetical protein
MPYGSGHSPQGQSPVDPAPIIPFMSPAPSTAYTDGGRSSLAYTDASGAKIPIPVPIPSAGGAYHNYSASVATYPNLPGGASSFAAPSTHVGPAAYVASVPAAGPSNPVPGRSTAKQRERERELVLSYEDGDATTVTQHVDSGIRAGGQIPPTAIVELPPVYTAT